MQAIEVCAHVLVLVDQVLSLGLAQGGEDLQPPPKVGEKILASSFVPAHPVSHHQALELLPLLRPKPRELETPTPLDELAVLRHHVLGERRSTAHQDRVPFTAGAVGGLIAREAPPVE